MMERRTLINNVRLIGVWSALTACAATAYAQQSEKSGVLADLSESFNLLLGDSLILCFFVIAAGLAVGALRLWGLSLGASGVLFASMLLGHVGRNETWSMPQGIDQVGLVLFVYTIGIAAGPTFFRALKSEGKALALLAIINVAVGAASAVLLAWLLEIPADLAAGLFAGAMTSTPALAAGIEAASAASLDGSAVSIGYGLAYPVGVVAVVLFVQLYPRVARANLEETDKKENDDQIDHFLVEIKNPALFGKHLNEVPLLEQVAGQITRVLHSERLTPIPADHLFEEGQIVMVVASKKNSAMLTMLLGERSSAPFVIDTEQERRLVVVTQSNMLGKSLRELHLRTKFGVTVARIERYGVSFVPLAETVLCNGDRLTVVGEAGPLRAFEKAAGHRERRLHETDLMSLAIGLTLGIVLGIIPITLPGGGEFKLGLAGGPLLVGLLLGHFGQLGGVVGFVPQAARMLLQELGLVFFLATAGFSAGHSLLEMVQQYGVAPFAVSAAVAAMPMIALVLVARFLLRLNLLQTLGGMCGAMTSTAGLGALSDQTDSDAVAASYAAAYPTALVFMTIAVQVVIALLG